MNYAPKMEALGIDLRGKRAGNFKTTCPQCSASRKKPREACLSVNITEGIYNCWNCHWTGSVKEYAGGAKEKEYNRPNANITTLSDNLLSFFLNRGISQATVNRNQITSDDKSGRWLCFPYYRGEELINYKYRHGLEKKFQQFAGAESIFYGLNDIVEAQRIVIVEGELDKMAFEEAGILEVLSVPQGGKDRLDCITNCFEYFDNDKLIYIAVDKDPVGLELEEKLLDRFGRDRCRIVDFPQDPDKGQAGINGQCKDANRVLLSTGNLTEGKALLIEALATARELPIAGVLYLNERRGQMLQTYHHGKPKGETTHFTAFDGHYSWLKGQVKCNTGIPNHGKTELELQLMLCKSIIDGWKWAVFSPESYPADEFYDNLIHAYVGKGTDPDFPTNYMSEVEYLAAMDFVQEHFFYVYPEEDHTPDKIRDLFRRLVLKHGVDGVLIDPFNQLDHDYTTNGGREDLYLSRVFKEDKRFALEHNVCLSYISHPKGLKKRMDGGLFAGYDVPDAYDLSGGAMWNNKMDVIYAVHRPNFWKDKSDPTVELHIHKIKNQKRVGTPATIPLSFDRFTNRYVQPGGFCPIASARGQAAQQLSFDDLADEDADQMPF